ncbi:MAG: hypothetical protein WDZ41_00225 [Candidatus Babeliales bacterium]
MQKLRVGVLMGGKSKEREVSFNSGRTICDHLDTLCYEIIPLFQIQTGSVFILPWSFLHRGKISDFEYRLAKEAKPICWDDLKNIVDFIYIAMHGRYAEDGILQGLLEILNIPYLGSKVFASAVGMDKIMQKMILKDHGIGVARDICVMPDEIGNIDLIFERLKKAAISFPCIVKPHKEGSSLGMTVVNTREALLPALQYALSVTEKNQPLLIEEKINGMEFSCIVITDWQTGKFVPLAPTEIVTPENIQFFDYEQKYMPGKSLQFTPARCSDNDTLKIKKICLEVMHVLEFKNYGRIDGFLTPDKKIIIIDPNTFSGAAPSSFLFKQAAEHNLNHTQLINHLIKTELKNYGIGIDLVDENKKEKKSKPKLRIAVLMGGQSNEKEISLESGRNVIYKLSPEKYNPIPFFVNNHLELFQLDARQLVCNSTKEIVEQLDQTQRVKWHDLSKRVDFVFIALHGGHGENGCVQGMLEMLDLPYNGSSIFTSALCINKFKTNQLLKNRGFAVPKAVLISKKEWLANSGACITKIKSVMDFPCIIKPHDDGCSVLVFKAISENELIKAIETIIKTDKSYVLIEECVVGMELTGAVIGNKEPRALPPSQTVVVKDILSIEEKFLPGKGENLTPAPLAEDELLFIQQTLQKVYKTVDCKGYARIDCFYQNAATSPNGEPRLVILEINTLPGLTPATCIFHQAAEIGLRPMEFIDLIIQFGLQEHNKQIVSEYDFIKKNQQEVSSNI